MATKALASKKTASRRVGRSPITGHYVLAPVTKEGSVTLEQVRAVIRQLQAEKQAKAGQA